MSMKRLSAIVAALALFATPSMAFNIGFGISGAGLGAQTEGEETLKTSKVKTSAAEEQAAFIPSGYVEVTLWDNGIVVGYEKVANMQSLGSKMNSKMDLPSGDSASGVNQKVSASIDKHHTIYVETPSFMGMYLKVGYSEVDVITDEELGTGAVYGDFTMDGTTVGIGAKHNNGRGMVVKFETFYTDYDAFSVTSDSGNTIAGDVEAVGAKFAVGYQF